MRYIRDRDLPNPAMQPVPSRPNGDKQGPPEQIRFQVEDQWQRNGVVTVDLATDTGLQGIRLAKTQIQADRFQARKAQLNQARWMHQPAWVNNPSKPNNYTKPSKYNPRPKY